MGCETYVIVGLAKTGTTVIARTLQRTLRIPHFFMEPRNLTMIAGALAECERLVVKIIFDIWQDRLDDLARLCAGDGTSPPPTVIFVVRDPRDEAVSRLYYFPYTVFASKPSTPEQRASCIALFEQKEAAPDSLGLLELQDELWRRFRPGSTRSPLLHAQYAQFVQRFMDRHRDTTHLVRYEEFISRTIPEPALQAMLSDAQHVHPREQRVLRSASSGAWNSFFTDRDTAFFNQHFEAFLQKFGYPLERKIGAGPPVCSATGSEYVARLIAEACLTFEANNPVGPEAD
jgi:hypothetical protein